MSAPKFTPGPWSLGDENNASCSVLLGDEHNLTADMCREDNNTGRTVIERSEMLANAALIAAAPQLYAALKLVKAYFDAENNQYGSFNARVRMVIAAEKATTEALAKARGDA
jgi:hypothetical protein